MDNQVNELSPCRVDLDEGNDQKQVLNFYGSDENPEGQVHLAKGRRHKEG